MDISEAKQILNIEDINDKELLEKNFETLMKVSITLA